MGSNSNGISMRAGVYNQHSSLQLEILKPALELLPDLSRWEKELIHIVDYGCSQGQNSVTALSYALSSLPSGVRVNIGLNDTPSNDFNTLSQTVEEKTNELSRNGDLDIFKCFLPQSFYKPVLPPSRQVDIGISFSALHYLEQELPALESLPDDPLEWQEKIAEISKSYAVPEIVKFLRLRAEEFSSGGTLILAFPCQREDDKRVWFGLGISMRAALLSAVRDGILDKEAVLRHGSSMGLRTLEHVQAAVEETKDTWTAEHISLREIDHPAWAKMLANGNGEASGGSEGTRQAYVGYAKVVVDTFFAVYAPYVLQGIRKTKALKEGKTDVETGPGTEQENQIIADLEKRVLDYYCEHYLGSRFWVPNVYVKLLRK